MSAPPRLDPAAFGLLADLAAHNDRAWFEPRRPRFDELVVAPFVAVLEAASAELQDGAWPVRGGRATLFRQLRDQRYAKERPYATAVRALLTSTGTKPTSEGCVHVEVGPTGGFVGVGFHRPPRAVLDPIRRHIVDHPDDWAGVRDDLRRRGRHLDDDRLTRMPSGFEHHRDHRHAADLRLRSLVYAQPLTVDDWTGGGVVELVVRAVRDGMPLLRFGNARHPARAPATNTSP